jgi:mono/diheme cytochrome c family protein
MTGLAAAIILGSMVLGASYSIVLAQQPAPASPPSALGSPASLAAGVYTEAQARRGEAVYRATCAVCHGPALAGDMGPPLAGKDFIAEWKDMNVGDLLDEVEMTMPANSPGSLMPTEYADVLAYVLSVNKYPAGTTELGSDSAPLKTVKMGEPPQP